ncbi:MAG: hypothetical protein U5N53_28335 [Mycobacterium sp.]|nr:hypothetical protein [Mycobacterium sp.]
MSAITAVAMSALAETFGLPLQLVRPVGLRVERRGPAVPIERFLEDQRAAGHLTAISFSHPDEAVREAAIRLLRLDLSGEVSVPFLKLAEPAKDPLDCDVDDLGVVVVSAADGGVEGADEVRGGVGVSAERGCWG